MVHWNATKVYWNADKVYWIDDKVYQNADKVMKWCFRKKIDFLGNVLNVSNFDFEDFIQYFINIKYHIYNFKWC